MSVQDLGRILKLEQTVKSERDLWKGKHKRLREKLQIDEDDLKYSSKHELRGLACTPRSRDAVDIAHAACASSPDSARMCSLVLDASQDVSRKPWHFGYPTLDTQL